MNRILPGEVFSNTNNFDTGIRQLLPRYDEMLDTITNCLPQDCQRILELGCGTGELSLKILRKFPNVEVIALDYSPRMIQFATSKVTEAGYQQRWTGIEADFGDWANNSEVIGTNVDTRKINIKFDACVSSLAIHHLSNGMKLKLAKQVCQSLNSHGCFWNADPVLPESPAIKEAYHLAREKWALEQGKDLSEIRSQLAMNDQSVDYCSSYGHSAQDQLATLNSHLTMLSKAGFQTIAVPWKYYGLAVFGGWVEFIEQ
ncbi:MAG: class I SAM-dependent methyltransferase [Cyanobacteria bacterium P01_A01_bin.84]